MIVNPYVFGAGGAAGPTFAGAMVLRGVAPSLDRGIAPAARGMAFTGLNPIATRLAVILQFGASSYTPPTSGIVLQFDNVPYTPPVST
jgi:hypothetical protein